MRNICIKSIAGNFARAILFVSMVGCGAGSDGDSPRRDGAQAGSAADHDSLVIELSGEDSASVFDLLVAEHQVHFTRTAMGAFVRAIDSVRNATGVYWVFSVNDTMAWIAADKYITSNGDRIRWHFRDSRK